MADYNKIGLLVISDGTLLLCRKKYGTELLILPGGCIEGSETALECLNREIKEELGNVSLSDIAFIGAYSDQAATVSRLPKTVRIELYTGRLLGEPVASSEIRDLVWFGPDDALQTLSPSLRKKILPDLLARKLL